MASPPPQVDSAAGPAADLCPALPGAVPGVGVSGRCDGAASGPHHQGIQLFNTHLIQRMSHVKISNHLSHTFRIYKDNFKSSKGAFYKHKQFNFSKYFVNLCRWRSSTAPSTRRRTPSLCALR